MIGKLSWMFYYPEGKRRLLMSDVNDRYVIDKTILEDGRLKLIIFDPLQWDCVIREQHS